MIIRPGQIVLAWNAEGQLQIQAPLDQRDACLLMLASATAEIAKHDAPKLVIPNGRLPNAELRNRQN